jgi:hypothetical protein
MIVSSFIAGYLSTMNIWTVNIKHVRWHLNDLYMVLLMTSWMLVLGYLLLRNHMINSKVVFIIAILFIVIIIYAIRKQFLIDDKNFLNGMIPHHSMAILMAKRIKEKTKDPRIIKLANEIIKSQSEEINQMTNILNETGSNRYIF